MKRIKKPEALVGSQRPELPWKHLNGPSYNDLIRAEDVDQADQWRWDWEGPGEPLRPVTG